MKKRNVFIKIEYDGTMFSGWQRQPGLRTVQGELERALSEICRTDIKINGTSRTDAGVHALGQCASFEGEFGIPADRIPVAVNNILCGNRLAGCGDIRILSAEDKEEGFHARYDAKGKKYIYRIRNSEVMDVFRRNYCYQVKEKLDIDKMRLAAEEIKGTHDFKCFQSAGGEEKETTVRTVFSLDIKEEISSDGEREILIEIAGDGFLYNMVRIITGTLIEVGSGRKTPDDVCDMIKAEDRRRAGHTAPPQGLYLAEVYYKVV